MNEAVAAMHGAQHAEAEPKISSSSVVSLSPSLSLSLSASLRMIWSLL